MNDFLVLDMNDRNTVILVLLPLLVGFPTSPVNHDDVVRAGEAHALHAYVLQRGSSSHPGPAPWGVIMPSDLLDLPGHSLRPTVASVNAYSTKRIPSLFDCLVHLLDHVLHRQRSVDNTMFHNHCSLPLQHSTPSPRSSPKGY